jgi:hypothetical protein
VSQVVTIGAVTTQVVTYKDQRVCTTEQLAKFYKTDEVRIRQNHARNSGRFEEGKHYVKATGADLKNLRVSLSDSQIPAKARSLILWTDRGAARHAKMLETDAAWEVFEQLEDSYFTVGRSRGAAPASIERSTKMDRLPLYHFAVDTVIRHHLLFSKVYMLINLFAGSRSLKDLTPDQIPELLDFCDRFALGQDTRNDWQRITDNQARMYGAPAQLDMVQKLLLS